MLAPWLMQYVPQPVLGARAQRSTPRVLEAKSPGEKGHLKLTLEAAPMLDVIGFRLDDAPGLAPERSNP